MAIKSDAQRKAVAKYNSKNYEQINIRVKQGEKEKIQEYAEQNGESLNSFIIKAINAAMGESL